MVAVVVVVLACTFAVSAAPEERTPERLRAGEKVPAAFRGKTYYGILGIPAALARQATPKQIRTAYLKAARKYHPDRNKRELRAAAEAKWMLVRTAMGVLTDKEKREAYDDLQQHGWVDHLNFGYDWDSFFTDTMDTIERNMEQGQPPMGDDTSMPFNPYADEAPWRTSQGMEWLEVAGMLALVLLFAVPAVYLCTTDAKPSKKKRSRRRTAATNLLSDTDGDSGVESTASTRKSNRPRQQATQPKPARKAAEPAPAQQEEAQEATPRPWTEDELNNLRLALAKHAGNKRWKKIAKEIPGRSRQECTEMGLQLEEGTPESNQPTTSASASEDRLPTTANTQEVSENSSSSTSSTSTSSNSQAVVVDLDAERKQEKEEKLRKRKKLKEEMEAKRKKELEEQKLAMEEW